MFCAKQPQSQDHCRKCCGGRWRWRCCCWRQQSSTALLVRSRATAIPPPKSACSAAACAAAAAAITPLPPPTESPGPHLYCQRALAGFGVPHPQRRIALAATCHHRLAIGREAAAGHRAVVPREHLWQRAAAAAAAVAAVATAEAGRVTWMLLPMAEPGAEHEGCHTIYYAGTVTIKQAAIGAVEASSFGQAGRP